MLQAKRITGTLIVHYLNDTVFNFIAQDKHIELNGEITLSDRTHEVAAHIIAREWNKLVIWQDMCGRKHFVQPDSVITENASMFDPRDNHRPAHIVFS